MPKITQDVIEDVATLARLNLTADEKKQYADQLSAVFDYMAVLDEVDVSDVEETSQVTGLEDVVRDDVINACDAETVKKLVNAFPENVGNLLSVKAVFDT